MRVECFFLMRTLILHSKFRIFKALLRKPVNIFENFVIFILHLSNVLKRIINILIQGALLQQQVSVRGLVASSPRSMRRTKKIRG
jgi:hypothetical protein